MTNPTYIFVIDHNGYHAFSTDEKAIAWIRANLDGWFLCDSRKALSEISDDELQAKLYNDWFLPLGNGHTSTSLDSVMLDSEVE